MNRPKVDQGSSVPLVHVAAFDGPSLPSSPPPASGRQSRDRRGGGDVWTEHHTATALPDWRRGCAVVQGHTPMHTWAIWLKCHHYQWSYVRYHNAWMRELGLSNCFYLSVAGRL